LLAATGGPVLYLDPDVEIYAPLDDLAAAAEEHDLAVMPHVLKPIPNDRKRPSASDILAAGVYNLGFLGVGPGVLDTGFFDFWCERLWRYALVDPTAMLFTDQRWIDFVDCFKHVVIRDPTCNLAYWNVWGYDVARDPQGTVTVNGAPLRFFHFSGFDISSPHQLSKHQGDAPRVLLSEHPVLADVCGAYASRLAAEGHEILRQTPYGWGRSHGIRLTRPLRRLYREAVIAAELANDPLPPGPFAEDDGFLAWLYEPVVDGGPSRVALDVHRSRPDLQAAFPDPHGVDAAALAGWAAADAGTRGVAPLRPSPYPERLARQPPLPGVNIAGYFSAELGVGEAARLVSGAAASVAIPHALRLATKTPSPLTHQLLPTGSAGWPYDTNLLCVNADCTRALIAELGDQARVGRRTVGLWFWETQRLPERMRDAFEHLDEVWAASSFTCQALARDAPGAVRLLHLPVRVPTRSPRLTRCDLGLPKGFLVLYNMSFHSVAERKNPLGAVHAYLRAFGPGDGTHLVIKTIGGDIFWEQLEALRAATRDRPDVHIADGYVRSFEALAMIAHCDCYLSLHRSEGFGLTMAEAMARGRPVVATGWSGNMDFMDERTARLVPYRLVDVPDGCDPYSGTGVWAEPDLDAAAEALRSIHDDPRAAAALGQRAKAHIAATRSEAGAGRRLEELLSDLRSEREPVPA